MHHEKQEAILQYWFGDDSLHPLKNQDLWFTKDKKVDEEIRVRFGDYLEDAATGAFDDWAKTVNGALAFVILCDQFPRNAYRGEEKAFLYDERALRAAQIAVTHRLDQKMNAVERCFLYMPFEHSEDIAVQNQAVDLFTQLLDESQGEERKFVGLALDYAQRHREIIRTFGRFPHRNELLSRKSTRSERDFLRRPGSGF